ncbi:MAG: SDR family oxidoreductase [Actinobacteria bacterium]|nr:SDR family oxidoreductase [Actinomycetota bacterium]
MARVSYDLSGDVVVVTGAARGIGRDIALGFAAAGADVVASDLATPIEGLDYEVGSAEELAATAGLARDLEGTITAVPADVRDEDEVEQLFRETLLAFEKVDILVNAAGVYLGATKVVDMSKEQWQVVVDVNLGGPFLCSKHAARAMTETARPGRIVTIASTSALIGIPYQVGYQSSKSGLLGQVRTLALELSPYGITVNAVCPTVTETAMLDHIRHEAAEPYLEEIARLSGAFTIFPGVEALEPRDVTRAVMWLASDDARYVTGVALPVDGGFTIK